MLNKRCLEILKLIVTAKNIQTVDELSLKFSVSKRMIRYDIDAINDFLSDNNISQIQKKANSPLKIELDQEEQERILKVICELNTDSYILSTKERIGILLYELLSSDKPNTYSELQEKLAVSKTTLMSDIKKVKEWLKSYNLLIEKFSNKGVTIKGEEWDVRRAITTLLVEDTEYNIITLLEKVYKQITVYKFDGEKKFSLSTVNVGYIQSLVVEIEDDFGMFSDYDFMNLTASIYIVINRSLQKKAPLKSAFNSIKQCYKKEYEAAYKVSQHINDKFGIVVNNEEVCYLATRILSASKNDTNIFD